MSQRARIMRGSRVCRWAVRVRLAAVVRFLLPERLFPPPPALPFLLGPVFLLELAELLPELAEREPPRPDPLRDAVVPLLEGVVPLRDAGVPRPEPDVPDLAPPLPGFEPPVPDCEPPVPDCDLPAALRDPPDDDGRRRFPLAETVVGSITSGGSSL